MNIKTMDNDLLSIQEAKILAENASEAQKILATFPQEKIDEIVARMAEAASLHANELAELSADETGYGNSVDKAIKNRFVTEYLPKKLKDTGKPWTGRAEKIKMLCNTILTNKI